MGFMGKGRDATDTIIGYYYQFDYTILQLLELQNEEDAVTIEGIEDVDIQTTDSMEAVQCKYCAKTEYNHSVIAVPIRLMLRDYVAKTAKMNGLRYKLYGHYKTGHEKYPDQLTVEFAKKHLFTYIEKGKRHFLYDELNLSDSEIEKFLDRLDIDIHAEEFEEQEQKIKQKISGIFQCDMFEAEFYFYNNALRAIRKIATYQDIKNRTVTKKWFLKEINQKKILFDKWYIKLKGEQSYNKSIKKKYFTKNNISPYERFFLVECDNLVTDIELKELVINISNKWSRLSFREKTPFCPYFYFSGLTERRLLNIKTMLHDEGIGIWDGHSYLNAKFCTVDIIKEANYYNGVKAKIINSKENLWEILENIHKVVEIYIFYLEKSFYENEKRTCFGIQIPSTNSIKMMI